MTEKAKQIFNVPNATRAAIALLIGVNAWFLNRFAVSVDGMQSEMRSSAVQRAQMERDIEHQGEALAELVQRLREVERKL